MKFSFFNNALMIIVVSIHIVDSIYNQLNNNGRSNNVFIIKNNSALIAPTIAEINLSESQCIVECYALESCRSLNYDRSVMENPCHLFSTVAATESRLNFVHMIKSKKACSGYCEHSGYISCYPCKCKDTCSAYLPYICDCTETFSNSVFTSCKEVMSLNLPTGLYHITIDSMDKIIVLCQIKTDANSCNLETGDGTGGAEIYIGTNIDSYQCIQRCTWFKENEPSITGITVSDSGSCYCERNMNNINRNALSYDSCLLNLVSEKGSAWITVMQIASTPFYSTDVMLYRHGFGEISRNFWLGLDIVHRMTILFNMTLRIEYYVEGNGKTIFQYTRFKILDNVDYKMSYTHYIPLNTPADFTDNMKCRNNQPFLVSANEGAWWGNNTIKNIPFYTDGMYWNSTATVVNMKMYLRKADICEELAGDFSKISSGTLDESIRKTLQLSEGILNGSHNADRPNFYGEVSSEDDANCYGMMTFPETNNVVSFTYILSECKIQFGNGIVWQKQLCYASKIFSKCEDVYEEECPTGKYWFEEETFCDFSTGNSDGTVSSSGGGSGSSSSSGGGIINNIIKGIGNIFG